MKLIIFPLLFLVIFSTLSLLGISDSTFTAQGVLTVGGDQGYYDANGHQVCYLNLTASGEAGYFSETPTFLGTRYTEGKWTNSTGTYFIYNSPDGQDSIAGSMSFDMGTALGVVGLVVALMILATIAGLHVFGSGTSDIGVDAIFKGTGYLTLWGIFSLLSLPLVTSVPMFGVVFYFFLTILYCLGVINSIGHPGDE